MKIYTKTGDSGETGLLGGIRVGKHHPSIEVCGSLDELNSWIGVLRGHSPIDDINSRLESIQIDLFNLGAAVASCLGESKMQAGIGIKPGRALELESWMDKLTDSLPPQTAFILPGGTPLASWFHLTRSVCRRAERHLVKLMDSEEVVIDLGQELIYLNRLSDLLFLLARKANIDAGQTETEWLPK